MNKFINRIEINPQIMGGKPVIKGTRIPVGLILEQLANEIDVKEILADYPRLTREDIQAAIHFAVSSINKDEFYPLYLSK